MDTVIIACPFCGATERQQKKGRTGAGTPRLKCHICGRQYALGDRRRTMPGTKPVIVVQCVQCGSDTTNPKFCSKSCAAIFTNKHYPKKKKQQKYCKHCGVPVYGFKRVCDDCNPSYVDWSRRTMGELRKTTKYHGYVQVRVLARQVYLRSNRPRICQNCGYNKYVEICHIHAIGTFPDDTPIAVVSGIENLVALCPNCHWEFDHGLLTIDAILRGVSSIPAPPLLK